MPKVNEDMPISPPMGMNFRPQLPRDAMPWKAPQMAHSVGYQPDPYHIGRFRMSYLLTLAGKMTN